MNFNKKWQNQFEMWRSGEESEKNIRRLLKHFRRLDIDLATIQDSLSSIHYFIDKYLLDPQLLPLKLLLNPDHWNPIDDGVNKLACLNNHSELSKIEDLLPSGILNKILKGELSLYEDLPPIPIRAYKEGLNAQQRKFCRDRKICALEHLAAEGWQSFRSRHPVAIGLDRHQSREPRNLDLFERMIPGTLLVLDGDDLEAQQKAIQGGWDNVISCQLNNTQLLSNQLNEINSKFITICHSKDILEKNSAYVIAEELKKSSKKPIITCDDIIVHNRHNKSEGYEHRQFRSQLSPWRLYTRGALGGLLTLPAEIPRNFIFQNSYTCMEAFRLDLLLGSNIDKLPPRHISQPLVRSPINYNPVLPEHGWPAERNAFNEKQLSEIDEIRHRHGKEKFARGGFTYSNRLQPGSHNVGLKVTDNTKISIVIPFRDQASLTQKCFESILKYSGKSIPYEIILINNCSIQDETIQWINSVLKIKNVSCVAIDGSFNLSRLNNQARQKCKGNFLLFLNNNIEFMSDDMLQELLNPFAHPNTTAVGAKLNHPDLSIQHQGVIIISGERRCVLEPGKYLNQPEIIESLLPLRTQEEFSAASAACLMVRAESFDAIGGFDEELAVAFNDVDLCLRLREAGGKIIVSPHPTISLKGSTNFGEKLYGEAWIRHQRESGHLRWKHQMIFSQGDSLVSPLLHHHSNRYEPAAPPKPSVKPAHENILYTWVRSNNLYNRKIPLIYAQFEEDSNAPIRNDILNLLREYRRYFYIQVVAATPALLNRPRDLRALKKVCDGLIIRRNEGYDYGSWMTGIRFCKELILRKKQLIICNDSFWGPVRPIKHLIKRLSQCNADVIGLTDNLMYKPHLQSPFLMFNERAISCPNFWTFWDNIQCWHDKRSIVKYYEVGLPVLLKSKGLHLKSLYSTNANGNILHSEWKKLIEDQNFPFIKISLLRDNPRKLNISDWKSVVRSGNKQLAFEIENQLKKLYTPNSVY